MTDADTDDWLAVRAGEAPLLVSIPHSGTLIPGEILPRLRSPALARRDTDWYLDQVYAVAADFGATVVHTTISRCVIDVNRDPGGRSLYPGMATTDLCPLTTFDGEPLYAADAEPDPQEISRRRDRYYLPYHAALRHHLQRLRGQHARVVLFDAHSIRSQVPRLFAGILPTFNLGTNSGASCAADLTARLESVIDATGESRATNGRFKGGYITRAYGQPIGGVHAVQLETAMRTYLDDGPVAIETGWPPPFLPQRAALLVEVVPRLLAACLEFAVTEVAP